MTKRFQKSFKTTTGDKKNYHRSQILETADIDTSNNSWPKERQF